LAARVTVGKRREPTVVRVNFPIGAPRWSGPIAGRRAWLLTLARWSSAIVFASFGAGKFVNHAAEARSFRGYGLPAPDAFTDAIGVLELAGAALLLIGLRSRLAAIALAGDMVGAIILSGIAKGELISLTLAPVLLIAMIAIIGFGAGPLAIDAGSKSDIMGSERDKERR
jgi:putative oxidoreductase